MNAIDKAADRLRGRWVQGTARSDDSVCVVGAFWAVEREFNGKEIGLSYIAIAEELESIGYLRSIVDFNDDPSTTEEDVLLLMKKASARLDEMSGS